MDNMKSIIEKFNEDGFVMLEPGVIFSNEEILKIEQLIDQTLPEWEEGFIDAQSNNSRKDPRFGLNNRFNDITALSGCASRHMLHNGHGSAIISEDDNFLFGKRSVVREKFWPEDLYAFVENKNLHDYITSLLGCSSLSFHNGSINKTYPGNSDEPRKYHMDTASFQDGNKPMIEDRFLINALIFLSDVDEDLAPIRFIPGTHTHLRYTQINEKLAQCYKQPVTQNNLASSELWEELLPADLRRPEKMTGKKGSVCLFNTTLIHSCTENKTKDKSRKVMIMNFSSREHTEFYRNYSEDPKGCLNVYKNFKDKSLVKRTFLGSLRPTNIIRKKIKSSSVYRYIKKFSWKTPLTPIYMSIKEFQSNKPISSKMYLNIGAGANWHHPEVIGLDYDQNSSEVGLDLNHKTALPFETSRLKGIYSSHCLEHLKESRVKWWFGEAYRTLENNGIFRVTVPDMKLFFDAYEAKDAAFFNWLKGKGIYRYNSWLRIIVRHFAEPVVDNFDDEELYKLYHSMTREEFLQFFSDEVEKVEDERFLIPDCHKSFWTEEKMIASLQETGFSKVGAKDPIESDCEVFRERQFNQTRPNISLFVEATK